MVETASAWNLFIIGQGKAYCTEKGLFCRLNGAVLVTLAHNCPIWSGAVGDCTPINFGPCQDYNSYLIFVQF